MPKNVLLANVNEKFKNDHESYQNRINVLLCHEENCILIDMISSIGLF
jgi:FtsZ-binding cell division protein ZapB